MTASERLSSLAMVESSVKELGLGSNRLPGLPQAFLQVMCSLPLGIRCGWCGRPGAQYIPDGIDPPVPLCVLGPRNCLFVTRTREDVMRDALAIVCRSHVLLRVRTAPP